jgi:hypothetical protein
MLLLLMLNLNFAWGEQVAPASSATAKHIAKPKTTGGMKTRQ